MPGVRGFFYYLPTFYMCALRVAPNHYASTRIPSTTTVAARDVRPLCSSAGAAMVAALHLWRLHEPAGPSYSLEQR